MDDLDGLIEAFLLDELEHTLVTGSNLPGPRANLSLAARFARAVAKRPSEALSKRIDAWLAISAEEAPTGDPREFLPFCALQALGASYQEESGEATGRALRTAANDERWRTREGVTMALQLIGEADFSAMQSIIDRWLPNANLLEQRAIVTALAHPPILNRETADYALVVTGAIGESIAAATPATRKTEPFKVLRQGLGFAPSLFVVILPEHGFALFNSWIETGDKDLRWIVRENLKKNRLTSRFPDEIERMQKLAAA
jgi:hypothetical protein